MKKKIFYFFKNFPKILKIIYEDLRGNSLPNIENINFSSNTNLSKPKKNILIAVSTGGLSSMLVFESLIGKLLQNENCKVDYLLCDEVLPACVMATIHRIKVDKFRKHGSKKICSYCYIRSHQYLKKTGSDVLKFSNFINFNELQKINEMQFNNDLIDNIKNFKNDDINIGEHANSGAIRYFSSTSFKDFKNSSEVLKKYIKAALITQKVSQNLFKQKNYDEIFINHGIYVPQGVILEVAKKFGINTSTWCYAYARKSVNITRDDTYHKALVHEKNEKWKNFYFDQKAEKKIDDFLKQRREGKSIAISDNWNNPLNDQDLNIENYLQKKNIDVEKPIIGLATNMLWDAQVYFASNFFKDILEWLFFTIEYFFKRPDLQLVIRIHPAETLTTTQSLEKIEDSIFKKYKVLPGNIFIIKPEDKISTYSIFNKCNSVLVYGSKIAMETMAANIPTIVCGESFIRNKQITFDPNSKKEYLEFLNHLPFLKNPISQERLILAKKYAFHFFFRRTIRINSIYERKSKTPSIGIKPNVNDIINSKNDPGLKMIIDSIINGDDFIFKAEDYLENNKEELEFGSSRDFL